jgi:hypothetical protein
MVFLRFLFDSFLKFENQLTRGRREWTLLNIKRASEKLKESKSTATLGGIACNPNSSVLIQFFNVGSCTSAAEFIHKQRQRSCARFHVSSTKVCVTSIFFQISCKSYLFCDHV